ncbi:MAG: hypothetical protein U0527_03505 [Candidatus Eisenbacteria bacterium]
MIAYVHDALTWEDLVANGARQLWIYDLDAKTRRYLTEGAEPTWSPDGEAIAFVRQGTNGQLEIWEVRVTNGAVRRLATSDRSLFMPDWHPSENKVLYVGGSPNGLWTVDTSTLKSSSVADFLRDPDWSPDGKAIAGGGGVRVMDMARLDSVRTLIRALTTGDCAWAPSGDEIAFDEWGDPAATGISVINVDTGARHPLVALGFEPTWSPDGRRLAFAARDSVTNCSTLFVWDREEHSCEQLTSVCDYLPPDSCDAWLTRIHEEEIGTSNTRAREW